MRQCAAGTRQKASGVRDQYGGQPHDGVGAEITFPIHTQKKFVIVFFLVRGQKPIDVLENAFGVESKDLTAALQMGDSKMLAAGDVIVIGMHCRTRGVHRSRKKTSKRHRSWKVKTTTNAIVFVEIVQ